LNGCELGGQGLDGGSESGDLSLDGGCLSGELGHDGGQLSDDGLRSLEDLGDHGFSLWSVVTELTDKNLFSSGHSGQLFSQVSDQDVCGFLLFLDREVNLVRSLLLDLNELVLLLKKLFSFFHEVQFFLGL